MEIIITHLTHNLGALKARSLTCRSWYTTTVPQLHHTLTLTGDEPEIGCRRLEPLSELHQLGLINLVKIIRLRQGIDVDCWFTPQAFTYLNLHHFSALVNVHTLKLQNLEISRFGHPSNATSDTSHKRCNLSRCMTHVSGPTSSLITW